MQLSFDKGYDASLREVYGLADVAELERCWKSKADLPQEWPAWPGQSPAVEPARWPWPRRRRTDSPLPIASDCNASDGSAPPACKTRSAAARALRIELPRNPSGQMALGHRRLGTVLSWNRGGGSSRNHSPQSSAYAASGSAQRPARIADHGALFRGNAARPRRRIPPRSKHAPPACENAGHHSAPGRSSRHISASGSSPWPRQNGRKPAA